MNNFTPFYESARYKEAHLSRLHLPADVIEKMMEWVKKDESIFFFAGSPGVGKTYFCAAYIHKLQEDKKHFRYFSEYQFFSKLRQCVERGWEYESEIERICEAKYLIIDDIGTARGEQLSDFQKEALHTLIDIRYALKYPTLITSNLFKEQLKQKISDKIASRLFDKDNLVIELDWIDKRQEA